MLQSVPVSGTLATTFTGLGTGVTVVPAIGTLAVTFVGLGTALVDIPASGALVATFTGSDTGLVTVIDSTPVTVTFDANGGTGSLTVEGPYSVATNLFLFSAGVWPTPATTSPGGTPQPMAQGPTTPMGPRSPILCEHHALRPMAGQYQHRLCTGLQHCHQDQSFHLYRSRLTRPSAGTTSIAIDNTSTYAYVPSFWYNTVTKINLSTFTVVGSLTVGSGRSDMAMAIDNTSTYAYVTNNDDSTVTKINLSTFTVVGSALTVGNGPISIAIDNTSTYAYVVNSWDNTVTKINLSTFLTVS